MKIRINGLQHYQSNGQVVSLQNAFPSLNLSALNKANPYTWDNNFNNSITGGMQIVQPAQGGWHSEWDDSQVTDSQTTIQPIVPIKKGFFNNLNGSPNWYNPDAPKLPLGARVYNSAIKGARAIQGNKTANKIMGAAGDIYDSAMAFSPLVTAYDNYKKDKEAISKMRESMLPDNLYSPAVGNDRGDWDINDGIFRPNNLGFKSKGMYTNQFSTPKYAQDGGTMINDSDMDKIRIRIVGDSSVQHMAYGGQSTPGYGLDLGARRVFTEMPEAKSDSVSNTITAVPRDQANIEAEGGETVYGDIDGDGGLEHMNIKGKRHTEGGVPLNVPEGSFIFSDTKKMKIKSETILKFFGLSPRKDGYTPAEIAKRYDINKYKAVLEDPDADQLSKDTATLMIKNYKKKLAYLSIIQESMKDFPEGIPQVAREGGIPEETLQKIEESLEGPSAHNQQEESQEQLPNPSEQEPNSEYQDYQEGEQPMDQSMEEQPEMQYGGDLDKYQTQGQVNVSNLFSDMFGIDPNVLNINRTNTSIQDEANRRALASGRIPPSFTRDANGNLIRENIDSTADMVSNTATGQYADATDPEYGKFLALLDKYDTKTKTGYKYINKIDPVDAAELARLSTKFGFSKKDAAGKDLYRVMQGSNPGLTFASNKNTLGKAGFFGGYGPEMYEKLLVEDELGSDAVSKMSPLEIRKQYFKTLGVNTSGLTDAQLSDTNKLYTNKKFFEDEFYPKFTSRFQKADYRPEMGDDYKIGIEHYDSFKKKPKNPGSEILGYICTGNDASGKPMIQTSSYMDEQARDSSGASKTWQEAAAKCGQTTGKKKGWRCLGLLADGKPNLVFDEQGTFDNQAAAAAECSSTSTQWDYLTPDKVNMQAAIMGYPKKRLPYKTQIPFEPGNPVFEDWRAKAAARQSQLNNIATLQGIYGPTQGFGANTSFAAGVNAEGLGQDIAQVDSRNVERANLFNAQERQRKDANNLLNSGNAQDYYKGMVIAGQQQDDAERRYFNNVAKTFGQAWGNRMNLGLTNFVNPMYNIDPRSGRAYFVKGYDPNKLASAAGQYASQGENLADLNRRYLTDVPDGKGMSFKEWSERQGYGAMTSTDKNGDGIIDSRRYMGQQLAPAYGRIASNFQPPRDTE
jgi:hypothetical protein